MDAQELLGMIRELMKTSAEEHIEKEIERNVRRSPSEKAPRPDKERRRIKIKDPDLDQKDPDMSMNYKDIGGSRIARRVAIAYAIKRAVDFETEEAFQEYYEKHPGADLEKHTIRGKPIPAQEEAPKGTPKEEEEPGPKRVRRERRERGEGKKERRKQEIKELAQGMQEETADDVYAKAEFGTPEEQEAAIRILQERKTSIPSTYPPPEEYEGHATPEMLSTLQEQIRFWDGLDYDRNMHEIETKQYDAMVDGNDKEAEYYHAILSAYKEMSKDVRAEDMQKEPKDLLKGIDADAPAFEVDPKEISKKRRIWHQSAMFSSLNTVVGMQEKVQEALETVAKGTQGELYLRELDAIATDVRDRKMFDKASAVDRLAISFTEGSFGDIDRGDFDFTDARSIGDFVGKVSEMDNADIMRLVKEEPTYLMYFSFSPNDAPEDVVILEHERNQFLHALAEDLAVKGSLQQISFKEGNQRYLDPYRIREYRDKAIESLREVGVDPEKIEKGGETKNFWDVLLDWADDVVVKLRDGR